MQRRRGVANDILLTPEQAADFLGVSKETLAQWRSERRGPRYIKLEKRLVKYLPSDLQNYLSAHSVEPSSIRKHSRA